LSSFLYNLLLILALPGAFFYYLWRIFVTHKANLSWKENLGIYDSLPVREPGRKLVWIHSASVGEVIASLPIQEELRRLLPDAIIFVTTITQTGNAVARRSAKHADVFAFFPIDYSFIVKRALTVVKPDVFVVVETEIWPNFLSTAKKMGVPTIMVNGRISDRSMNRSKYWRWLFGWATSNIDYCAMQSELDADRIRTMGANKDAVHVFGNTKFDQEGSQLISSAVNVLRTELELNSSDHVIVAGSTNPGEEEPVINAFSRIRMVFPDTRLIIAPRQLERSDDIEELVQSKKFSCARRSRKDSPYGSYDVMILDTFGELAKVYAAGSVAFVGGTLIPKGGHSIIQPILQGKPVFFGPYTFKTRDIASLAISSGVGFQVADEHELADMIVALLSDTKALVDIERACKKLVAENKGASARCAKAIVETMKSGVEAGSAS
jgi:3-deoxy-D-manno-octulosonic-acid transferase